MRHQFGCVSHFFRCGGMRFPRRPPSPVRLFASMMWWPKLAFALLAFPLAAPAIPLSPTVSTLRVSAPTFSLASTPTLRVCADPDNLPFSDRAGRGFENAIVRVIAQDLNASVAYSWRVQRRGFAGESGKADQCDLWIGVADSARNVDMTVPYYRSTYVFVTRNDRKLNIRSFDDVRLRKLKVGIQLIGGDADNTPPAAALARRDIVDNVVVYADDDPDRPGDSRTALVNAVADGSIDVAVMPGPLAGYYARRAQATLRIAPVESQVDGVEWPMAFDVSIGVRRGDLQLKHDVEQALAHRHEAIVHLLDEFDVPRVDATAPLPLRPLADAD